MTAYALEVPEVEHLRIRIPADIVEAFSSTAARKNLSKQGAIEKLLRFWLVQDDVAQSMMVGQVTPTPDLVTLVLHRLIRTGLDAGTTRESHPVKLPKLPAPLEPDDDQDEEPPAKGRGKK